MSPHPQKSSVSFRVMDFSGNLLFPNSFIIAQSERRKGPRAFKGYSDLYLQRAETCKKGAGEGKSLVFTLSFKYYNNLYILLDSTYVLVPTVNTNFSKSADGADVPDKPTLT